MVISDQIIERTAEIWARLLSNPRFDNGDNAGFASVMATAFAAKPDPVKIEAFRLALISELKFMRDNDGKEIPEELRSADNYGRILRVYSLDTSLSCDYHPDEMLTKAATAAGFEKIGQTLFPWKTDVFMQPDCVIISAGYRAEMVYHYPLPDTCDMWLITTCKLSGSDGVAALEFVAQSGSEIFGKVEQFPQPETGTSR